MSETLEKLKQKAERIFNQKFDIQIIAQPRDKKLTAEQKERLNVKRTVSAITFQLYGNYNSEQYKEIKKKLGLKGGLRNKLKVEKWPWKTKSISQIAKMKGLSRQRCHQIKQIIFNN